MTRLQWIQALRAVAALAVAGHHGMMFGGRVVVFPWSLFSYGYLGVDLFFVLSGFVMAHAHWAQAGDWRRTPQFLWARATRIYPLYWTACPFYLLLFVLAPSVSNPGPPSWSALVLNGAIESARIVPVGWTLGREVAFYVIFASWFLIGRVGLAVAFSLAALLLPDTYLGVYSRYFAAGACVAVFARGTPPTTRCRWLVLAGLSFLVVGSLEWAGMLDAEMRVRNWVGPNALVIWAAASYRRPCPAWLVALGDASYVIYLGHYLLLQGFLLSLPVAWVLVRKLAFVVYLLSACGLGVWIRERYEAPLLRRLRGREPVTAWQTPC